MVSQSELRRRNQLRQVRLRNIPQRKVQVQEVVSQPVVNQTDDRTIFLVNRVLSGKPLPFGTSREEQRSVEKFIENNPEVRKGVERASSRELVGRLSQEELNRLSPSQVSKLQRLGLVEEIPSVKSVKVEDTKPTTINEELKKNFVRDGNSIRNGRKSSGFFTKLSLGTSSLIGSRDDFEKERETFTPLGFVSASNEPKGTALFRQPSLQEQIKIQKAQEQGSISGILTTIDDKASKVEEKLFGQRINQTNQSLFFSGEKTELPKFVSAPFDFTAKKLIEAGEFTEKKLRDRGLFFKGLSDKEVSKSQAEKVLSDALKISAFSPLTSTATAQQTSAYAEVITSSGRKIFVRKSQVKDFLLQLEKKGGILSAPSRKKKFERLDELFDNVKDNPQAKARLIKWSEESYGKAFVKDYLDQRGLISATSQATTTTTIEVNVPKTTQIKGISSTTQGVSAPSRFAGTGQFERSDFVGFGQDSLRGTQTSTGLNQALGTGSFLASGNVLGLRTSTQQDQRLRSGLLTSTNQISSQTTTQQTRQRTAQRSLLSSLLTSNLSQGLRTRGQRQQGRGGSGLPKPRTTPKGITIKPKSSSSQAKKSQLKRVMKQMGFYPEVLSRGRWKRVSSKPHSKASALALASNIVDNSVSAQLRLRKAGKPAKIKLNRRIDESKFRNFKVKNGKRTALANHGRIELKRNRIDTFGEKQELSASRYMKTQKFKSFSKSKKSNPPVSLFGKPNRRKKSIFL